MMASDTHSKPLRLFGPGPTNMPPEVCHALSNDILSHLNPDFVKTMDSVVHGLQELFQTKSPYCLCVSGTGHAGMECGLFNLAEPDDVVLVCSNGIWGERFARLCQRNKLNHVVVEAASGQTLSKDQVKEALIHHKPRVLFVVQGESSSGAFQDVSFFHELRDTYAPDCLLLVDAVASVGGVPLNMDAWGLDCVYTASQKCLAAPPGLSPIAFSERAMQRIRARKCPVASFYFDVLELVQYWLGLDKSGNKLPRRAYHHTGSMPLVTALHASLQLILHAPGKGLLAFQEQHTKAAEKLREILQNELGFALWVSRPEDRLTCITAVSIPQHWLTRGDGIVDQFLARMRDVYRVEIAGGLGPTAGKVLRIGLMGPVNATEEGVELVVSALRNTMTDLHLLPTAAPTAHL